MSNLDIQTTAGDPSTSETQTTAPQVNGQPAPQGTPSATEPPRPAFEFRNLHRFFGRLKAVNNVSFKAYPGEVVGFIGPNGAGKTTSMRILATLDVPTAGDALVEGYSVIDDPDKVRRVMGFMPDAFGKYYNVSVVEYLDFYARAYGLKGARRKEALDRVLVFTELHRLRDKPIDTLSKGLSQRLGLGRTLIHDPSVLILDEPAAGLDPRARVELRELIHLLAREQKKTVLISSHILTELSEICDSAVIIEAGKILAGGTVDSLMKQLQEKQGTTQTTINVRVLQRVAELERKLLEQPFIESMSVSQNSISFQYSGGDSARAELLRQLVLSGFEIVEFQTKSKSLEDAFMEITRGVMQ